VVRLKKELPSASLATGRDRSQDAKASGVTCSTESWLGGYRNPAVRVSEYGGGGG
jgi:hypothetical protein